MSRIREIELKGIVSTDNSSANTLDPDEIFVGTAEDVADYGTIVVSAYSDVASAIDGLCIQFSTDGTNWDHSDDYTLPAATSKTYSVQRIAKYFRVVYTNGGIIQGEFRLQTTFNQFYVKPSSHRLSNDIIGDDDATLNTSVIKISGSDPETFHNINAQHPMPIDGDSVYLKDIDFSNSDNGGFSGVVTDYFDSLKTVNTDSSATNPKIITVRFNRSIQTHSIGLGCDDIAKNFSNVILKLLGSADEIRQTVDLSADNTKYNSLVPQFTPDTANGVIVEFHTADEVGLSNLIIYKATDVNARLQAVSNLTGGIENINSSRNALTVNPYGDFRIEVARGNIEGNSYVFFAGINEALGATYESVTPQGGLYPWPAAAAKMDVVSTDANDTAAGTGARTVYITGLDADYEIITETVTMDGLNPVETDASFLRINGFIVLTAGTGGTNAGDIDILNGADIIGRIEAGVNAMGQGVYTIPAGYTAFNTSQHYTSGKDDEIKAQAFADIGGTGIFLGFGTLMLYESILRFVPQNYFPIPEKSDIDIRAIKTGGVNGRLSVFYEMIFIENAIL